MQSDIYLIPKGQYTSEITITKSKFLSTLRRIQSLAEMRSFHSQLQADHPKANHHCWAVIAGSPNDSGLYGFSDDGEPKGTAGKPIFNVLQHSGKGQLGVIVTRYFGGVKLGTGGLVRAYTQATKSIMENASFVKFSKTLTLSFSFPYEKERTFRYVLEQHDIKQIDFSYSAKVHAMLVIDETIFEVLQKSMRERLGNALQMDCFESD